MNLWNVKDLPLPPVNTYRATNDNIDLRNLHNTCKNIKLFFDDNEYMKAEYLVLSRIIYRMKQKFRSAKDFKALEKVHKALENYFNIQISKYVGIFMDMIPLRGKDIYLPTKNLLDYILVRFQGLVKLLERIVETSKIAGFLLNARTKVGHFWKVAFISFSLISRVYILAKHNANCICEFYDTLLPFTSQLQNIKNDWLPKEYKLPMDLKEWMDVDWLDINDDIQIIENSTETSDILQFIDLIKDDDDDVEFCDEYQMVDDDTDVEIVDYVNDLNKNKGGMSVSSRGFYNIVEDLGEVIDVDDSMLEKNKLSPVKFNESIIGIEDSTKKKKDGNKNTLKGDKQIDLKKKLSYDADEDSKVIDITNNIDKAEEDLGEVINIEDSISIIEESENFHSSGNVSDGSIEIVGISKRNVNKKSYKIGKNYSAKKMRGSEEELYLISNIKNIQKKFDDRKKRKHFKKKKRKMVNYIGKAKKLEDCHKVDTENSIKKSKQKIELAKNKRKSCDFVSENVCSKKIKLESPNMNRHNQHSSKNVLMNKKKKQHKKKHQ